MDIATRWNEVTASGEYRLSASDLQSDAGLKTAVLISLFTDRRAAVDDVLPVPGEEQRGWWGSEYLSRPLGSRLWLLEREKQTQEVLNRAREYAKESLHWMIEDGVALGIDVQASFPVMGWLLLVVRIRKPAGEEVFRFQRLWDATMAAEADSDEGVTQTGYGFLYNDMAAHDGGHDYSGVL